MFAEGPSATQGMDLLDHLPAVQRKSGVLLSLHGQLAAGSSFSAVHKH